MKFVKVDLKNEKHRLALIELLNDYMLDEMGIGEQMPAELAPSIINGLKSHPAYVGFFVCVDENYAALANCNINFSTWKGKKLLNIHDFIVASAFRNLGVGFYLLEEISKFAHEQGYCRINLEVRNDNVKAKNLYKKAGFNECEPPNHFWEKKIE